MRDRFPSFYSIPADQWQELWSNALVVLDANVLLNIYRRPDAARKELLDVLEKLKKRIWIPYHAALEFQRNRLNVIANEQQGVADVLKSVETAVDDLQKKLERLKIRERGLDIEVQPILTEIKAAHDRLAAAIGAVQTGQQEVSTEDPLRDQLDQILEGRVGEGPTSQADLKTLIDEADYRYELKIPPGFSDAKKDKGGAGISSYSHAGIRYEAKFGDLIVWKQLIAHAKESAARMVIFVTDDQKDDWWWREQGKTMGPDPELVSEIRRNAGVEKFWMYTSAGFLENAKKYISPEISPVAVEQLRSELSREEHLAATRVHRRRILIDEDGPEIAELPKIRRFSRSLRAWLSNEYPEARVYGSISGGFRVDDGVTQRYFAPVHIDEISLSDFMESISRSSIVHDVKAKFRGDELGVLAIVDMGRPLTTSEYNQIDFLAGHVGEYAGLAMFGVFVSHGDGVNLRYWRARNGEGGPGRARSRLGDAP